MAKLRAASCIIIALALSLVTTGCGGVFGADSSAQPSIEASKNADANEKTSGGGTSTSTDEPLKEKEEEEDSAFGERNSSRDDIESSESDDSDNSEDSSRSTRSKKRRTALRTITPSNDFNSDRLWFLVSDDHGHFDQTKEMTVIQFNDDQEYRALRCAYGLEFAAKYSDSDVIWQCELNESTSHGKEGTEWQPFDLVLFTDPHDEDEVESEGLILKDASEYLSPEDTAVATVGDKQFTGWYTSSNTSKNDQTRALLTRADSSITEVELDSTDSDVPVK